MFAWAFKVSIEHHSQEHLHDRVGALFVHIHVHDSRVLIGGAHRFAQPILLATEHGKKNVA